MKIKFVPQDCWIGLYWKTNLATEQDPTNATTWYLCIIPCLPIIWTTYKFQPTKTRTSEGNVPLTCVCP